MLGAKSELNLTSVSLKHFFLDSVQVILGLGGVVLLVSCQSYNISYLQSAHLPQVSEAASSPWCLLD